MPSDDDIALVDHKRLRWETTPEALLGEGSFGVVYRGRFNGTPVAIKVVKRPPPDTNASEELQLQEHTAMKQHRREIHRFKVVQNPYIIQYLGVFRGPNPRDLYIVTEFLEGGSLHESLTKMRARKAVLDDRSFLQIALHIAFGLNHVHASQYTHGDMKPQNILLTDAFQFHTDEEGDFVASLSPSAKVKIADFGLSKRLEGAQSAGLFGSTTATTDFGTGPCGTYLYMSPEAYHGVAQLNDSDAKAADVYAYGLVLFELLSGLQSWALERVKNPMHLGLLVREGKRPQWGPRESCVDSAYISLVERCWSHQPSDRPTVDEIVNVLLEQQDIYSSSHSFDDNGDVRIPCPPAPHIRDHSSHQYRPKTSRESLGRPHALHVPRDQNARPDSGSDESDHESTGASQQTSLHESPSQGRPTLQKGHAVLEGSLDESVQTCDDENQIFTWDDDPHPPIRQVQSMRLTSSQVNNILPKTPRREHDQEDSDSETDSTESEEVDSYSESEAEEQEEPEVQTREKPSAKAYGGASISEAPKSLELTEDDQIGDGIGDSVVGNIPITKVDSVRLFPPEIKGFSLPQNGGAIQTMGLGSVAGQETTAASLGKTPRSNTAMLNSFIGVPLAGMTGSSSQEKEHGSPVSPADEEGVLADGEFAGHPEDPQGLDISEVMAEQQSQIVTEPSQQPGPPGKDTKSHPQTPEETAASLAAAQQRREKYYASPNVDFDETTLTEFGENDNLSLYDGAAPFPNPGSQTGSPGTLTGMQKAAPPSSLPRPSYGVNLISPLTAAGPERSNSTHHEVPAKGEYPYVSNHAMHHPSPYGSLTSQGASAPPLSDTLQSVMPVPHPQGKVPSPSWQSVTPPDSHHRMPHMDLSSVSSICPNSVDSTAVMAALQRADAPAVLRNWWHVGHARTVASGLVRAHPVGGQELLSLVCDFISQINRLAPERRDPSIATDLCTTIGHIARNSSEPVGPSAVARAIPTVLHVLPSFRGIHHQAEVYSSAHFALCNLFKVYNVVADPQLRSNVASWIAYSLSWNIEQGGGPHSDSLAYTATCAARNFMWMNEANVEAFVSCNRGGATRRLIASMRHFDWSGRVSVLEASLSALAMIIHFPRRRVEFLKSHGAEVLSEALNKHADNVEVTSLVFSMLTVLFSGPVASYCPEEMEILRKAFVVNRGCQGLLMGLEEVRKRAACERQRVESLERGYYAALMIARFCGPLRANLIDAGCMPMILSAVRELATASAGQSRNTDEELTRARGRLGAVLCELVREVSNEPSGIKYMRDNNVGYPLQDMLRFHPADDGFTNCCRVALERLAAY